MLALNIIETHEHAIDFKESLSFHSHRIALLTKNRVFGGGTYA
jgi:hypothetical protein